MTDPYEESLVNPNMKDEVLKLLLIVENDQDGRFSKKYLLEKLRRIHDGIPIALHPILQWKFNALKLQV